MCVHKAGTAVALLLTALCIDSNATPLLALAAGPADCILLDGRNMGLTLL